MATPQDAEDFDEAVYEDVYEAFVNRLHPELPDGYCDAHHRLLTYQEFKRGRCSWCHPEDHPSTAVANGPTRTAFERKRVKRARRDLDLIAAINGDVSPRPSPLFEGG